jgi:hypothetical protein
VDFPPLLRALREGVGPPLPVGLFVDASVQGRSLDRAFVLPRSALRGADQIMVAGRDGLLSIRTVPVIDSDASRVIVASGIEDGEWVVTSPLRGAADGMAVTPLDADGEALTVERPDAPEGEDDEEDEDGERRRGDAALVSAG